MECSLEMNMLFRVHKYAYEKVQRSDDCEDISWNKLCDLYLCNSSMVPKMNPRILLPLCLLILGRRRRDFYEEILFTSI